MALMMAAFLTLSMSTMAEELAGINTEIFADLKPTKVLAEGANEGPAWHPEFGLYFSGGGGINHLTAGGKAIAFRPEAGTNGILFDADGRMTICQPKYRRVSRIDLKTNTLEVLTDSYDGHKYNQPNDLSVDSKGRIYFSDPKYGPREDLQQRDANGKAIEGVYRIDLDGSVTRIIEHEADRPNGLLVSPDDKYLYVADNNNNQSNVSRTLLRFELQPDGTVKRKSKKTLFDWKTGRGPDGMVMDEKGRLYVAGGLNKPNPPHETAGKFKGGVYVLSADGDLLSFVAIPNDEVTNCTFGDADLETLFITAGGSLWKIRTKSKGISPMTLRQNRSR